MQQDLFPIELPPGLFRNGTRYQAAGRWYDANLIRFQGPRVQPVGGWRIALSAVTGGSLDAITGVARGLHAWSADSGSVKIGIGTHNRAYALVDGTVFEITPPSFVAGAISSSYAGGSGAYGSGSYGSGAYGTGSLVAALLDADTWSLDNFGDFLVGCFTADGRILVWDGNTANDFAVAAGAPTGNEAVVVTPERFLVALAPAGNKRKVQWPDQESTTVWTPGPTTKAGSFELATNGRLRCGARTTRETLLWTDADVWAMTFIGGTLVYSFRQAGDKCGIIAPLAKVVVDTRAFWMGSGNFYEYNGAVRPLPCEVQDHVFGDINRSQLAKIYAQSFAEFGEVVWFYCSAGSTEIDRYVVYNYRENHWNTGRLVRLCGVDAGALPYPMLVGLTYVAQGTLTSTGTAPANGDTVTIGSKTYTFQTVLTNVNGNVLIGASAATALANLYDAINLGPGAGTDYATATTLHPTVEAVTLSATTLVVRAKTNIPTSGNLIVTTETSAQLSWGAATLAGEGNSSTGYAVSEIYEHEIGDDRGSEVPFVESGPYELDGGNHLMGISRLVPDEKNQGDVRAYIYTSLEEAPNAAETLNGPYTMASSTDVRLTARIARIRFEQVVETAWRIGTMRFALTKKGRR